MASSTISVEVAYARPERQCIVALDVEPGCTVYEAAVRSRLDEHFPEIDWAVAKMGIFGVVVPQPKTTILKAGERVEIYRPLIADPKDVRKERAAAAKARRTTLKENEE